MAHETPPDAIHDHPRDQGVFLAGQPAGQRETIGYGMSVTFQELGKSWGDLFLRSQPLAAMMAMC